jgi:hypothetical protein
LVKAGWMKCPSRDGWLLRSSTELLGAGGVGGVGCIVGDPEEALQPGALAKSAMAAAPSPATAAATMTAIQRRFIPAPPLVLSVPLPRRRCQSYFEKTRSSRFTGS